MKRHTSPTLLVALFAATYEAYLGAKPATAVISATDTGVLLVLRNGQHFQEVSLRSTADTWEEISQDLQKQFAEVVARWEEAFTEHEEDIRKARKDLGLPSRNALDRNAPRDVLLVQEDKYLAVELDRATASSVALRWPRPYRRSLRGTRWYLLPADHPLIGESLSRSVARCTFDKGALLIRPALFRVTLKETPLEDCFKALKEVHNVEYYNGGRTSDGKAHEIYPAQRGYNDPDDALELLRASNLFATVDPVENVFART